MWLLARSRRERLARVVAEQVDVEVAAGFLVTVCAAALAVAVFFAPAIAGPRFAGHQLVAVLPLIGALSSWGLRHFPRTGTLLAALSVAATVWVLVAVRADAGAGVAPPRGALPWTAR